GTAAIISDGTIIGDIRLDAGDDRLLLRDGSFEGGIYGGNGNNLVEISAAVTYTGSRILDGGEGDNDRLTLRGQTVSNTTDTFLNWEHVALQQGAQLNLSGVGTLDTALNIDNRSEFRAFGQQNGTRTEMILARDVTNEGRAVFSVQDGDAGDVIRVEGNYTGSGTSLFALDARMDGTDTDMLHFTGDVSGDMEVLIASVGNAGATGGPLEIYVVSVDGEADDATFTLMDGNYVMSDGEHGMISGAYVYRLAEVEAQDGSNWWALSARSESGEISWGPSLPTYDSYGQALLALNGVSSLRNRGRSQDFRSLAWDGGTGDQNNGSPLWVQMGVEQASLSEEHSTTGAALDSSLWEMEIGGDIVLSESGAGLLVGGLVFSYGTGSTDVSSDFGGGSIDTSGLSLGVTATWYDARRFYVDGQFTFASYSSDLDADRIGSLTEGNGGTGYALSIEAGQQLDLGSRLTVIPQAQLSFSSVAFDDFTSEAVAAERVTFEDASSQQLRLGLEFGPQEQGASGVYGIVNLYHEFGAGSEVTVAG
ncbi:autotransporter outer membrane beta-barrel domain-containing protein, partial [uncultured Tateyamaria sp.]|uniref:autotransporter outer membrane beta-barrel domain-containing protein n=1 Tax=uncultured Tateyamaria sp. TaxID=455651 RepID=UPI0026140731